jgi:CubicO group peptidase (beta-lactamase class C family)
LRAFPRRLIAASGLAAALVVGVPVRAADSLVLTRFGDYLESLRAQIGIPGVAAVIVGPTDIAYERALGQQDVERLVATSPDTPFHLDGLTETMTATLVLRCVQDGQISLEDPVSKFGGGSNDSIRRILMHTNYDGSVFSYSPQRLDLLKPVVEKCNALGSFRAALANLLKRDGMRNSVPGPDAIFVQPSPNSIGQDDIDRYKGVLDRLAVPYAVDAQKRITKSQYSVTGLSAASGLISSARDYARFDLDLKSGTLLGFDVLSLAWNPPAGKPHGMGWFVQGYNGEKVVWAFGQSTGSSSLAVILPTRSMTLILLANSDGLSKGFGLENGDLNASPFGKLFLSLFVK